MGRVQGGTYWMLSRVAGGVFSSLASLWGIQSHPAVPVSLPTPFPGGLGFGL